VPTEDYRKDVVTQMGRYSTEAVSTPTRGCGSNHWGEDIDMDVNAVVPPKGEVKARFGGDFTQ
jgi:hypothetical protein